MPMDLNPPSHSFPFERQKLSRGIWAWCFYDWANSSFSTIITTFVFANYFTQSVAINPIVGTAEWGKAIATAGIIIALLSPIVGSIADYKGQRKPWLAVFTSIAIVNAALLGFIKPQPSDVILALTGLIFGTIGLELASVFYNAMLKDIAPPDYIGRISGWGWGIGYLGGLASLLIALFIVKYNPAYIRFSGILVAIWYATFSIPLFLWTSDHPVTRISLKKAIRLGLKDLLQTFKAIKHYRSIFTFLLAHMIYIDGLNTLFAFGGIYAAGTFNMSFTEIIYLGIGTNIVAGIGAIIMAWIDDYKGSKYTLLLTIFTMIFFGGLLIFVHSRFWFWIFVLSLSFFVGPIQASSRSLMVRLTPKEKTAEMFGLYALSGKITAFLGPWFLSLTTTAFYSQRAGMATTLVMLLLGAFILFFVKTR